MAPAWYKRSRHMTNIRRKRLVAARSARYVHLEREKIRPQMNGDRAGYIHQKESRQQQPEVEPLIACHERIQPVTHISGAIPHSDANHAQIIRKQQPTHGEKCCYEREPARRVAKLC